MNRLAVGLLLYVVFLLSTCLHEAAHSWVALKGGDPTAYHGGQVSLDPIAHIKRQPIGLVVLPLITVVTIGWPLGFASAPYDPNWAARHPRRAGLMALAGPATNLLLAALAGVLINVGLFAGVFNSPETITFSDVTIVTAGQGGAWQAAAIVLGAVFAMNLLLAVFNALPLPPMDGSHLALLVLPETAAARYQTFVSSTPYLSWIGLFVAWQAFDYLFDPVFTRALNALYFLHGVSYSL